MVPAVLRVTRNKLIGQKWAAVGSLHLWIRQHRYLRAVPIDQGEATIALLLLWEADHGHPYPSQAVELVGRLSTFCKRLKEAIAADEELRLWLESKRASMVLTPGLLSSDHIPWSVAIDSAVGEPFLSSWKAHLTSLIVQRNALVAAKTTSSSSGVQRRKRQKHEAQHRRGVKRSREDNVHHHAGDTSRKAQIAKLQALRMAAAGSSDSSGVVPSSSLSTSSSPLPSAVFRTLPLWMSSTFAVVERRLVHLPSTGKLWGQG